MKQVPILAAIVLWVASASATAAVILPEPGEPAAEGESWQGPPPRLADRDRNRISDDLQARLAEAGPQDLFDVLVTFSGPGDAASAQRAVGPFELRREFTIIDGFAATMSAAQIRGLSRTRGVFRVEGDFEVTTQMDQARASFGVDVVNGLGYDGSGVTACVIDTGADPGHEQLDSKFAGGACWTDFVNSRTDPYDDHGHGTHVASILLGDGVGGVNAARYRGVAPGANLCAAKVLNSVGSGTATAIISGIEWCAQTVGADIISMSLGTSTASDGKDSLSQAVNNAASEPYYAIPVVAAGNSGDNKSTIGAPGAAEEAITVGAAFKWSFAGDALAAFSSRGPIVSGNGSFLYDKPDVAAPGVAITAAQANSSGGQGYRAFSGTSMATPFAAGAAALALQADPTLAATSEPLPVDTLRELLRHSSVDRGPVAEAPDFQDPDWGYGEIDVHALVAEASGQEGFTPFPSYRRVADTIPKNGERSYSFELSAADLGTPIGINIDIEGRYVCRIYFGFFLICGWDPDLDAELYDPDGSLIASSQCPGIGECGQAGRWETLRADATKAGAYTVTVYAAQDDFNQGNGGDFTLYFASEPLETAAAPPPPPPANSPPVAVDDGATTVEGAEVTLDVLANDTDADNDTLTVASFTQPARGSAVLNLDATITYTPETGFVGEDSFTYVASDGTDLSNTATVTVTVTSAPSPAGVHVGDLDGSSINNGKTWTANVTITVHGGGHEPLSGVGVDAVWNPGGAANCTTGADGACTVSMAGIAKKTGSVTFSVSSLDHPDYDAADNHDPDGDSDGTSITVRKP